MFDQSLDEERTLESVARLCVRDLADTCVIVLGTPRSVRRVTRRREPIASARCSSSRALPVEDDLAPAARAMLATGPTRRGRALPPDARGAAGTSASASC